MVLKVVEGKPSTYVVAQARRIPFPRLAAPLARPYPVDRPSGLPMSTDFRPYRLRAGQR